jgi:hypothetical protein
LHLTIKPMGVVADDGISGVTRRGDLVGRRSLAGAPRHAAAQCRNAGGSECRSAPIDVVLDLRRRPLEPRSRSCLLDGEVRACRQIPVGINPYDCRGCIALLRAPLRCQQDRLSSGLIENQYADGLCLDWQAEGRC